VVNPPMKARPEVAFDSSLRPIELLPNSPAVVEMLL
jgi:hypothetical protein